MLRFKKWRRRRVLFLNKAFAQSLAILIPVYATLGLLGWYLFGQAFIDLFERVKGWNNVPQAILDLILNNVFSNDKNIKYMQSSS